MTCSMRHEGEDRRRAGGLPGRSCIRADRPPRPRARGRGPHLDLRDPRLVSRAIPAGPSGRRRRDRDVAGAAVLRPLPEIASQPLAGAADPGIFLRPGGVPARKRANPGLLRTADSGRVVGLRARREPTGRGRPDRDLRRDRDGPGLALHRIQSLLEDARGHDRRSGPLPASRRCSDNSGRTPERARMPTSKPDGWKRRDA